MTAKEKKCWCGHTGAKQGRNSYDCKGEKELMRSYVLSPESF